MRLFWKKAPPQKVLPINDETSYEALLTVDFGSLITYPDENKDDFIENIRFAKIQAALGLQFDTISWANNCYDIFAGKRELQEISLHYSYDGTNYLLIDSYFDPIDQLDLIHVGFKTPASNENTLKYLCRDFYDNCETRIMYTEGTNAVFQNYPIHDETRKRFPQIMMPEYLKGKRIVKTAATL